MDPGGWGPGPAFGDPPLKYIKIHVLIILTSFGAAQTSGSLQIRPCVVLNFHQPESHSLLEIPLSACQVQTGKVFQSCYAFQTFPIQVL